MYNTESYKSVLKIYGKIEAYGVFIFHINKFLIERYQVYVTDFDSKVFKNLDEALKYFDKKVKASKYRRKNDKS